MDPFTQRMLERAKARREKLETKVPASELSRPRKVLTESNQSIPTSPLKPVKTSFESPKKIERTLTYNSGTDSKRSSVVDTDDGVAVQINIVHQNNVQVEVQVEEREITLSEYLIEKENKSQPKGNEPNNGRGSGQIKVDSPTTKIDKDAVNTKIDLRDGVKTRLQKLGKLYSEDGRLSSPIHQSKDICIEDENSMHPTSSEINEDTVGSSSMDNLLQKPKKFGRLAALADQINNWEDDTTHHNFKNNTNEKSITADHRKTTNMSSPSKIDNNPKNSKPAAASPKSSPFKQLALNKTDILNTANTDKKSAFPSLLASRNSPKKDIGEKVSALTGKFSSPNNQSPKKFGDTKFIKTTPKKETPKDKPEPTPEKKHPTFQPQIVGSSPKANPQNWDKSILDDLEAQGYRRASDAKSKLVYSFRGGMAAACAPPLDRKPSGKKRAAPPPPQHPPPPPPDATASTSSGDSTPYGTPEGDRRRDPLHMSVREKKAMFEKGAGRRQTPNKGEAKTPQVNGKPKIDPKPVIIVPVHNAHKQHETINNKLTISEKDIADKIRKEKEQDMKVILSRFQKPDLDVIEPDTQEEDLSSESSPLMGNDSSHKTSMSNLSAKRPPGANSPRVIINQPNSKTAANGDVPDVAQNGQLTKRNSIDSPLVVATLEDVKRIKVTSPKPGGLYPCLTDIEAQSEEEKLSCPASLNTSSDSAANEQCDDDWGNTSFGREVLQAVGVKKTPERGIFKTPVSLKAKHDQRNSPLRKFDDSSDESFNNENLDDLLDEAFDDELDTDGPTPPKQNKNSNGTKASNSFHFKRGLDCQTDIANKFKSPLKTPPEKSSRPSIIDIIGEGKKPLVHTVSFYRRQQSQDSQPSTPMKIVRIDTDENDDEEKEKKRQQAQISAQESRRRVKELLEEVAKQNAIIHQASQALNLCVSTIEFSGSTEQAEGERLLLLATHRRQACLHEVQRIQVEGVSSFSSHTYNLKLEEISFPLRREYVRQLNAEGAVGHYLVCLIKCQERVMATSLVKTDPDSFTLTFPDKFRLEGLDGDFKITLEAFALQATKEILPHDVKYHIATKKSGKLATPRKGARGADLKAPPPLASPGGPSAVRTPAMQPQGYCIFSAQQLTRTSFTLNKVYNNGPLEGSIRLKIHSERRASQMISTNVRRGFLTMFEEAGGFGAWHRRWCVLHSGDLSYWRYPDDEKKKTPMGSIELSNAISETVGPAPRDLCARPHTLLLEIKSEGSASNDASDQSARSLIMSNGRRRYLLAADTRPERDAWAKALNETLHQIRDREME